jgi:histidine triad (HIT) family protein
MMASWQPAWILTVPTECLFCKIFAREIPAKEAYRDDDVVAFEDIRPVAPTHLLVVPREHIPSVHEIGVGHKEILFKLVSVANQIADERKIARDGYRLVFNTGPQAGQSVYHVHLHLLGGRALGWPPG